MDRVLIIIEKLKTEFILIEFGFKVILFVINIEFLH